MKYIMAINIQKICPNLKFFFQRGWKVFLLTKLALDFLLDPHIDIFFDTYPEDRIVNYFRRIFDDVIIFAINTANIDKNLDYIILVQIELGYRGHIGTIHFRYSNKELIGDFHSLFDLVNSISEFETESGIRIREKFPIGDINFFLEFITVPKGRGRRANTITSPKSNRSIIQISEDDTTCLGSAILVGLAYHNRFDIFKGNLSEEKIKSLNRYRKGEKTRLNEGIASQSEIKQICDGNNHSIRGKLTPELYRICCVSIKPEGNDFADVIIFERALAIKIVIQNAKKVVLHNDKTNHNSLILFLYLHDNHYEYMSRLTWETKIEGLYQKENSIYCRYCLCTDKKIIQENKNNVKSVIKEYMFAENFSASHVKFGFVLEIKRATNVLCPN